MNISSFSGEKKTICFILELFFLEVKGGSELQAWFLARGLVKHGWKVHYIRENNAKGMNIKTKDGVALYSLPRRHTKLKWLNIFSLFRKMKQIKADYWYCRGTISYVFSVWLISKWVKGKVIWACSSDSQLSPISRKTDHPLTRLLSSFDRLMFFLAVRRIPFILLQSFQQKMQLEKRFGLTGRVLYNGHPVPDMSEKKRRPLLLWVGRLEYRKDPTKIAEIADRLKDTPYQFYIAGNSMDNKDCLSLFRLKEKENRHFRYLGELEREKLSDLLWQAKVLINTSLVEGFSNTFIEAWLHGLPVISLRVDPDDLIKTERLGFVSKTIDGMVEDIRILMEDEVLFNTISDKCRSFAVNTFSLDQNIDEFIRLFGV